MNLVDIIRAFVEGLALIVSPCILPVLPLVLAPSLEGGRARPIGIIVGFIFSFTAFALLSRQLVSVLHIDLDTIKNGSLVLLAIFGAILLSKTLSDKFAAATQRFAGLGSSLSANAEGGFFGGVLIGLAIGLVWTPCAGPIFATALVEVIRQQNDVQAFLVIIAFALGASMPMLIIALAGRQIIGKLGFFAKHAEAIRKTFGVLILASVAFIYSGLDPQKLFAKTEADLPQQGAGKLVNSLPAPYAAPEFAGIDAWLNSKPLTMKDLRGKVVLVDFWTYSCINCVRTLPYITGWDRKYRDKGLVIVGVHSPEFEFEKKRSNVEMAIARHGIKYPVALDNKLDTFTAFNNQYWPAHYLIDREGRVVYTHFGEGEYARTENNIRFLLGLDKATETMPERSEYDARQTPETYLGYLRAANFKGRDSFSADAAADYALPKGLPVNGWALGGKWRVEGERAIAQEAGASLMINFRAKKVFLVMGNITGKPISASLTLNGAPLGDIAGKDAPGGIVKVKENTLYELVNQKEPTGGILEIKTDAPGLEVYAFTFGS